MLNKLKKVKFKDIFDIYKYILCLIPALIYKISLKLRKKELWLICETKNTARDNGYAFYKYMKEKHPKDKFYYAINFKCKDFAKFEKNDKRLVKWSGIKHYFLYMSATKNLSSHKEGNPNQTLFTILHLYLKMYNNRVFLQHGITKDDAPMFYYKNSYFKYFVCGAKREYDYILEKFGYPKENVIYTGFARFDNLHDVTPKRQILLIPTWRRWFELSNNEVDFLNSDYFIKWNSFINNKQLINNLEKNNIELIFFPHFQMKKFIKCFNVKSKYIKLINDEIDIQKLLIDSSLMITDYSSVYMDFAYMKKPVIYYQFDYEKYRSSHFKEGYFSYQNDGFGPTFKDEILLVEEVIKDINNNFFVEEKYNERMNRFFELNDNQNCERIYKAVLGCDYND